MELHQLRYFTAVARAGSFTRAAEEEGMAQPTLSQQVKKLEDDLGVPLLERRGRSVRRTVCGEVLLPQAQTLLRQLADARQSVQELRGEVRGRLVVGCIPTIMRYLLGTPGGRVPASLSGCRIAPGGEPDRAADRKAPIGRHRRSDPEPPVGAAGPDL